MSFESDMRRATLKITQASEATIRATALQLYSSVVERTPVDTGAARGNWQTSTNSPATGTVDRIGAAPALAEINLKTATYTLADVLYLANNLPYIEGLEDGRSGQAPAGMVQTTVDGFRQAIDSNARKHRI